uniref:PX domain-containing protein n=1 Tax=Anolis carolinensis TaxID=28377 RepID=A0A803SPP7_ANOCA
MSRRAKEEYQRFYTVTEPRAHPKGHTEYKVTAKFISKVNPEDVKEIVVWKRYSDFKKLHSDLAYTHRNLFRRMEDFPSFPRAQVFGEARFEPEVIEERRKAAEIIPQLKEFFRVLLRLSIPLSIFTLFLFLFIYFFLFLLMYILEKPLIKIIY